MCLAFTRGRRAFLYLIVSAGGRCDIHLDARHFLWWLFRWVPCNGGNKYRDGFVSRSLPAMTFDYFLPQLRKGLGRASGPSRS